MKPLPRLPLAGALVLGALASTLAAAEPWPALSPLEIAAPPADVRTGPRTDFADGTTHPWAPPPLPPLPGAFLWADYQQVCPVERYFHPRHGACSPSRNCSRSSTPVRTLMTNVLDGLLSLVTYPSRKAAAHRACANGQCGAGSYEMNPALRDWGAYPPAEAMPSYVPPQPPPEQPMLHRPLPIQPTTEVPPAAPPAIGIDEGLPTLRSEGSPGQPAEPQRLYPGRAPVVELAPDVPIPLDPGALPPKNTIPKAGDRPPKNVIPQRSSP